MSVGLLSTDADYYVFAGTGVPLLGRETAKALKVLKIEANIAAIYERKE